MLTVVVKKYRNGRLESIVHGVCRVLAYAVTLYSVMAYAMMSFIQVQPVWDNVLRMTLSLSLHHCVLLLYVFSIPLTCRSSTMWSSWQKWAATGFSVFFVLMSEQCPFILMWRVFSISPTYCRPHFVHDMQIFYLSRDVVSNVLSPCNLAFECVAYRCLLAAFTQFVVAFAVAGG